MSTQKDKTDEIDACTPEALADNSLPIVHLLASYYVDDKRKGKLEPIANTLVFADDPQTAQFDPLDPQLFATNSAGALYAVGNEDMCLRKPLHGHPNQERQFVLPPPEVVSFIQQAQIAEGKQNEWQKALIEEMKQFVPGENVQTLKLEAHPIANLRVPTDNDDDKAYKKWYKKLDPKKPLLAYVMPKTRALMFMVNKKLPIEFPKRIRVSKPNHQLGEVKEVEWIKGDFGDFNVAVMSGTRFTLPDGVYKIKIPLIENEMVFQKNRWSHILTTPDENGEYSYTLGEMARFDIVTPVGEFDLINLNPISLEESMIVQYPRYYSHLLKMLNDPELDDLKPKAINDKVDIKTTAISDKGSLSPGFLDYALSRESIQNKAKFAKSILDLNLEKGFKRDVQTMIQKALHAHLNPEKNPVISKSLTAILGAKDGIKAFKKFKENSEKYVKFLHDKNKLETITGEILDDYFRIPTPSAEDIEKYNNTIGGRIGIPKFAFDVHERVTNIMDLGTNTMALAKDGYSYVQDSLPSLEASKEKYIQLAKDYYDTLAGEKVLQSITIRNQFRFESYVLESTQKEVINQHIPVIRKALDWLASIPPGVPKPYEKVLINITGHTCDLGGPEFNQKLSQQRADAVRDYLLKAEGLNGMLEEDQVVAVGMAYEFNEAPNDSWDNRVRNRRVLISTVAEGCLFVAPSREGMGTLERYRNLAIQQQLTTDKDQWELACQATDYSLGILSVIPLTAAVARGIILLQSGYNAMKSLVSTLDALANDTALGNYLDQRKRLSTLTDESKANHKHLQDPYKNINFKENPLIPDDVNWASQFRVRSEAVAGLIGLLMRASIYSSSFDLRNGKNYKQWIEELKIKQYIQNFIVNDDWLYPVDEFIYMDMATYWLYAIGSFDGQDKNKASYPSVSVHAGLDVDDFLLLKHDRLEKIKADAVTAVKKGKGDEVVPYTYDHGFYFMTRHASKHVAHHLSASFQAGYPIHQFSALESDELFDKFANTFKPATYQLGEVDIAYCRVFYRSAQGAWIPLVTSISDNYHSRKNINNLKVKGITPLTPIRVLLVFKKTAGMPPVVPVTFYLDREDVYFVDGPEYSELAKPLALNELIIDGEEQYEGHVGCVFYPFYQHWNKTYYGIKPVADMRINLLGAKWYHDWGLMDNMEYKIRCRIGNNKNKITLPLLSIKSGLSPSLFGFRTDEPLDFIPVKMDDRIETLQSMIEKTFLVNEKKDFTYPPLFKGKQWVRTAIKIGKGDSYINAQSTYKKEVIFKQEIQDISHRTCMSININHKSGGAVEFNDFNWSEPVELIATVGTDDISSENYKIANADWRQIPCEMTMFTDIHSYVSFGFHEGPTTKSKLFYLGKLTMKGEKLVHYDGSDVLVTQDGHCQGSDFDWIYKLLLKVNSQTLTDLEQEKILAMSAHHEDRRISGQDNERYREFSWHLFAAHFSFSYTSPKGKRVDSIKPFGRGILEDAGNEDYIKYVFRDFKCPAQPGTILSEKAYVDPGNRKKDVESEFHFQMPYSYTAPGLPWTDNMEDEELEKLKPRIVKNHYEFLKKPGLELSEAERWLDHEAKQTSGFYVRLFEEEKNKS